MNIFASLKLINDMKNLSLGSHEDTLCIHFPFIEPSLD